MAKIKALISFTVTAKRICAFVFTYADCWFSHAAAQLLFCTSCYRKSMQSSYMQSLQSVTSNFRVLLKLAQKHLAVSSGKHVRETPLLYKIQFLLMKRKNMYIQWARFCNTCTYLFTGSCFTYEEEVITANISHNPRTRDECLWGDVNPTRLLGENLKDIMYSCDKIKHHFFFLFF